MEGFVLLSVLSIAMFLGCYIAGSVPLVVSFSERKLRLITVLGAGLLVGTALAVIIPEGVQSLYKAQTDKHNLEFHSAFGDHHEDIPIQPVRVADKPAAPRIAPSNLKSKSADPNLPHDPALPVGQGALPAPGSKTSGDVGAPAAAADPAKEIAKESKRDQPLEKMVPAVDGNQQIPGIAADLNLKLPDPFKKEVGPAVDPDDPPLQRTRRQLAAAAPAPQDPLLGAATHQHHAGHTHGHGGGLLHIEVDSLIGTALVLGFVFMLVVDQVASRSRTSYDSIRQQRRFNITATVGLVVHAAADGIALGAASTTPHADIQFIVFIAIMLHKAPAAFGLVAFLLHEGLEKWRIRKHLLVFALAAPVGAVLTYVGINESGSESLSSINATGVLMLFSAGTFLYVATVHVLPEIVSGSGHSHGLPVSNNRSSAGLVGVPGGVAGGAGGPSVDIQHSGFSCMELTALICGALMPTFISMGHSH